MQHNRQASTEISDKCLKLLKSLLRHNVETFCVQNIVVGQLESRDNAASEIEIPVYHVEKPRPLISPS